METYRTHSKEETRALGRRLAQEFRPGTLVTFAGDLGAGKTTLIQGILDGLGAPAPYPSPTFVLMNQYDLPQTQTKRLSLQLEAKPLIQRVYHADAYRVGAADFERLGFAEWCADEDGLVLLEWPERIAEILPEKRTEITLKSLSETEREITLK